MMIEWDVVLTIGWVVALIFLIAEVAVHYFSGGGREKE